LTHKNYLGNQRGRLGSTAVFWVVCGGLLGSSLALLGAKIDVEGLWTVKVESENLRVAPNGEKIGALFEGAQVETLKVEGQWVKVRFDAWMWGPSLDGFEPLPAPSAESSGKPKPKLLEYLPKIKRQINAEYGTFYGVHLDRDFNRLRLRLRVEDIGREALVLRQEAIQRLVLEILGEAIQFDEIDIETNRPDGSGQVGGELARIKRADLEAVAVGDTSAWKAVCRLSSDGGETWVP
jgi:hypothetical protein